MKYLLKFFEELGLAIKRGVSSPVARASGKGVLWTGKQLGSMSMWAGRVAWDIAKYSAKRFGGGLLEGAGKSIGWIIGVAAISYGMAMAMIYISGRTFAAIEETIKGAADHIKPEIAQKGKAALAALVDLKNETKDQAKTLIGRLMSEQTFMDELKDKALTKARLKNMRKDDIEAYDAFLEQLRYQREHVDAIKQLTRQQFSEFMENSWAAFAYGMDNARNFDLETRVLEKVEASKTMLKYATNPNRQALSERTEQEKEDAERRAPA